MEFKSNISSYMISLLGVITGTRQMRPRPTFSPEKKRFERWIRHEDVTSARLINTEKSRLKELVEGRNILGIQDTTENNYQSHDGRAHGLRTVGNGKRHWFFSASYDCTRRKQWWSDWLR